LFSQNRADIWYFGDKAGLDFSSGNPLPVNGSKMLAEVGCATICDTLGQLLFYTNGREVWNRDNNIMPNGDSLEGGIDFVNQNSLVIPHPGKGNLYYLFTIDTLSGGLRYSIVDMTLDSGMGDVSVKNILLEDNVAGKITAVNHCNLKYIWVIVREMESNVFHSYMVTDTGGICKTPVISYSGDKIMADIGMMKASPTGNIIALPINNTNIFIELFDFDNEAGIIGNPRKILKNNNEIVYAYGTEFSGDGKFFYVSTGGKKYELFQYDVTSGTQDEINESVVKIASGNMFSLQIGPDSKIYVARANDNFLSVINSPEKRGEDCDFEESAIYLGDNESLMGLPNFNQSYFYFPSFSFSNACVGDTTFLWIDNGFNFDSVKWSSEKANIDTIVENIPFEIKKIFDETGDYDVKVHLYHCDSFDTVYDKISVHRAPDVFLGNDTTLCEGKYLIINAPEDMEQYYWNTGDEGSSIVVWDTGVYWVTVSRNGCFASDTIKIENIPAMVQLPTAFTPNGDGINDFFHPQITGFVNDYHLIIYNRYGQIVWENDNPVAGWDGRYNGQMCPVGMYVWHFKYKVKKGDSFKIVEKSGNVNIVR